MRASRLPKAFGEEGGVFAEGGPLSDWVGRIVADYELDGFPRCWEHHTGLVEELRGLHRWWEFARSVDAGAAAYTLWHEALERFRERVRRVERKCVSGCAARAAVSPRAGGVLP